jgi:hypothetical protein
MIPIKRTRAAERGEAGYGSLYGMITEKSVAAFSKAEIVARLRPFVERSELPATVLSQVDSGLPISVLSLLGYSDAAIAKSEADALAQIRGSDEMVTTVSGLVKGATKRVLRQEDLAPSRRSGRRLAEVDAEELQGLREELQRLRKIEAIVTRFITASGGPRGVHPALREAADLDDV